MARKRAASPDVTLGTAEAVRRILEEVGIPVSRKWILDRLREQGRATNSPRLNRVIRFYEDLGMLVDGSKGVQWTHSGEPSLQWAVANGRRL